MDQSSQPSTVGRRMFHCENHSVRTHDLLEVDANDLISSQASCASMGRGGLGQKARWSLFAAAWPRGGKFRSVFAGPKGISAGRFLSSEVGEEHPHALPTTQSHDSHVASRCHPCFPRVELSRRPLDGPRPALGPGRQRWLRACEAAAMRQSSRAIWISSFYAERPMASDEATSLCDCTMNLPAVADIRVETPVCGFSLREFASRSPAGDPPTGASGIVLGRDPWGAELGSVDSNLRNCMFDSPKQRSLELKTSVVVGICKSISNKKELQSE